MAFLEEQAWPGNVRELSHHLEAALVLAEGEVLGVDALRAARSFGWSGAEEGSPSPPISHSGASITDFNPSPATCFMVWRFKVKTGLSP